MKGLNILLISAALPFLASAADTDVFTYDFHDDGTCTLILAECSGDVSLPETVSSGGSDYLLTAIGAEAFMDSRMTSVSLPSSILTVGQDAFRRCAFIEKVSVPSLEAWLGIEFANEHATPLYGGRPLFIGENPLVELSVPSGVERLKPYVFFDCSCLAEADLTGVVSVGEHAFDGCENLRSVRLDDALAEIGDWGFTICCSLERVGLPASLKSLGQGVFYGCSSLAEVEYPSSLEVVPTLCFAGCTSLSSLDFLPDSIVGVGDYAFHFCTGLCSARFPVSVRLFGESVFQDCTSLHEVSIPAADASFGEFMFSNCNELTSVLLPARLTEIPRGMFLGCCSLRSVDIPASVSDIASYAFADCRSLRYASFPAGLRHVGERGMYGCASLTRLEFPVSMESIEAEAFYQCSSLQEIHLRSEEPFRISFFSFDWRADREVSLFVPEASLQLYRDDTYGWGCFDNIVGLPEYNSDTMLAVSWGKVTVTRPLPYGSTPTIQVLRPDGSLPEKVLFDGLPLEPDVSGFVTLPSVTGNSSLVIE